MQWPKWMNTKEKRERFVFLGSPIAAVCIAVFAIFKLWYQPEHREAKSTFHICRSEFKMDCPADALFVGCKSPMEVQTEECAKLEIRTVLSGKEGNKCGTFVAEAFCSVSK